MGLGSGLGSDHVAVRDVLHERGHRLDGLHLEEVELLHELVLSEGEGEGEGWG